MTYRVFKKLQSKERDPSKHKTHMIHKHHTHIKGTELVLIFILVLIMKAKFYECLIYARHYA